MSINWQIIEDIISAEKLRRYANIAKAKSEAKLNANVSAGENVLEEQRRIFIQSEFLERDSKNLKQKIIDAARQGKYEVEVVRFPGAYCSDGGRAINNLEKSWPESLQGKAKSFYIIWKEHGHPHGYRLKARINDYPGGFIGEVSVLIDWS